MQEIESRVLLKLGRCSTAELHGSPGDRLRKKLIYNQTVLLIIAYHLLKVILASHSTMVTKSVGCVRAHSCNLAPSRWRHKNHLKVILHHETLSQKQQKPKRESIEWATTDRLNWRSPRPLCFPTILMFWQSEFCSLAINVFLASEGAIVVWFHDSSCLC